MIFCNETMNIKLPKKSFMKRENGKHKFAYAFGMFHIQRQERLLTWMVVS